MPAPTGPAVPVVGPLLVMSERMDADIQEAELHRVAIYDVGLEKYWTAFEYHNVRTTAIGDSRSSVQPAGTSLIAWSGSQIRRVSLDSVTETTLLDHDGVREVEVSPDGTKVAVNLYSRTLLILDTGTGEELLRSEASGSRLAAASNQLLELGQWRPDGAALSVRFVGPYGRPAGRAAIVRLDGTTHRLEEGWVISPDFRYALWFGRELGWGEHGREFASIDVLDVETEESLWTITADAGVGPAGGVTPWWRGGSKYVAMNLRGSEDIRLLDTATGETMPLTAELEQQFAGPVQSNCDTVDARDVEPRPCDVRHDGRIVWEGALGWTQYLGLIEVPGDFTLRGIELLEVPEESVPAIPPPWEPVRGPFLMFEVQSAHATQPRLLLWHEAGRGNTWQLGPRPGNYSCPPQLAHDGLVICDGGTLSYVPWAGETRVLIEGAECRAFRVSPDGTKVAVSVCGEIFVFALPSAEQVLHLDRDELDYYARLNDWGVNGWSADGTLLSITFHGPCCWAAAGAIRISDGEILNLPGYLDIESANLAPDARHVVRGRAGVSGEYSAWDWRGFDVIDFETEQVLWSVENSGSLRNDHWEWASADHFAWSDGADGSGVFLFGSQRPAQDAEHADVSVIDVSTGETEVMDSADYLARFHPPPRATTECPKNPGQPCKILLDGEVIGEGRWPRIIGFIEVD